MSNIPKKIHYCWFGGEPLPPLAKKCIDSWKKFFPDYEIIEWNESNLNININKFAQEAYQAKKYAFFTDVARLYIIYNHGGLYFDTDVEVIKSFDNMINNDAFFGIESEGKIATGLGFGAIPKHKIIKKMLEDYNNIDFTSNKNKLNTISCPIVNSKILIENGFSLNNTFEEKNGIAIYPSEYMNPKGGYGKELLITKKTVSIHHFDGSWLHKEEIKRAKLLKRINEKYGNKLGTMIYNTIFVPYRFMSKIKQRIRS